jgi:hypothetical protein
MKTRIIFSLIALLIWPASTLKSQQQPEQLNLPGDNLNLYAVMKIFQESETLELFEQKLNAEDSRVNNLDLNGDNFIDYIKVVDNVEKKVHYIVLQVAVTPTENQDVAVFVVKNDPGGKVVIQLIGDEALYGKYYIVEPYYDNDKGSTPNPGYYGNNNNSQTVVVQHTTVYQTADWPLIRFIFLPNYVVWHSPWYWNYYPNYWHPWAPWYWHEYYGYHYYWHDQYYGHYHYGSHYRYEKWHEQYYGHHRAKSNTFYGRRDRGDFNSSYSKPESIREGSAYFKKMHPDKARPDMKEPDLKDIRTAKMMEKQGDKLKTSDKPGNRLNNNQSIDKTKTVKPGYKPGTVKQGKVDNKPGNVKQGKVENSPGNVKQGNVENKPGNVKQGKVDTKPVNVKQEKTDNKPGSVRTTGGESKTGGTRPEKGQTIKKEETKSAGRPAARETNRQTKETPKKENPSTPKESGRPENK